ncbi:MAG: PBSX family phage terminase large subunit [Oscillospiraceae bacterium]|nr:PBSX family phage terminase large subunit [Oscillospiraceae bacterium]
MKTFSTKQLELLKLFCRGGLKRINILEGSVRSGKTRISIIIWILWVASSPKSHDFLMSGKTLTALKRNCLDLIEELVGTKNFVYSVSKKEAYLFGRRIYLEGASDSRAESKIRGMTLMGAYCDEVTLFDESFFSMLLSRLSLPGAKLIATTNPDSPNHWLMRKYISRRDELDMLCMKFTIDDNCFLDREYVESLKNEYSGVFYERFILGNWVLAEGLVYPMFSPEKHIVKTGDEENGDGLYYISVDYGTLNPCSMGLWRIDGRDAVRIKEYYHDGRNSHIQKTDEEYYNALSELAGGRVIQCIVIDPSAASFIELIRRKGEYSVRKAQNNVLDGIRCVCSMLSAGRIFINECCRDAIREFSMYTWDIESGEDKVIKENDHSMDDIRYFCNTILKRM